MMKAKRALALIALVIITLATVFLLWKPLAVSFHHSQSPPQIPSSGPVAHTESSFEFTVKAPYQSVVPLFGAYEERCWGGEDWKPEFLYPAPASDKQGEVFTQAHGISRSIWVNTALDLESGHIQYVYVVPDSIAALIDIHVKRAGSANTYVKVVYQQTALKPELNAHVSEAARRHREMGPHWAKALEECLKPKKS